MFSIEIAETLSTCIDNQTIIEVTVSYPYHDGQYDCKEDEPKDTGPKKWIGILRQYHSDWMEVHVPGLWDMGIGSDKVMNVKVLYEWPQSEECLAEIQSRDYYSK